MDRLLNKKAQFYLIAAIIIIIILLGIATLYNQVYTKPEPKKFYNLADILNSEGKYIIESSAHKQGNINQNLEAYLLLFSQYIEQNTNEDFNLIILYGSIDSGNVSGRVYSRSSLGEVNIGLGSTTFSVRGGSEIIMNETTIIVNPPGAGAEGNSINLTISSNKEPYSTITQTLPVLEDNNFIFVMTTSQGFNQYVQTNFKTEEE